MMFPGTLHGFVVILVVGHTANLFANFVFIIPLLHDDVSGKIVAVYSVMDSRTVPIKVYFAGYTVSCCAQTFKGLRFTPAAVNYTQSSSRESVLPDTAFPPQWMSKRRNSPAPPCPYNGLRCQICEHRVAKFAIYPGLVLCQMACAHINGREEEYFNPPPRGTGCGVDHLGSPTSLWS